MSDATLRIFGKKQHGQKGSRVRRLINSRETGLQVWPRNIWQRPKLSMKRPRARRTSAARPPDRLFG